MPPALDKADGLMSIAEEMILALLLSRELFINNNDNNNVSEKSICSH